ncbi:hypothetical protein SAMN05428969_2848 [Devosia sp. YR412]|uniref:hypothetical protein n=1 Tax=Devosia sp. YR412 TaxID=1881030 RepID=UPI0008C91D2A|nr:hypothetical protein [Devosia sp. YR412]SEQ38289.1 hypothetical protein SAMN05428969_2848 [Devosia sp. YR412]
MAKPGELAMLIADIFGAEEPTVRQQARVLRDAGLMSKEKAGRGLGSLTSRDAAHLLIAAAGTRSVAKSVALLDRPGRLVSGDGKWSPGFVEIAELKRLASDHTFAQALEALIDSAVSGTLQAAAQALEQGSVDLIHDLSPLLNIEVTIYGPTPRGAILIEELVTETEGGRYRYRDHFERHFYGSRPVGTKTGNLARMDVPRPDEMDSDLRTAATFSLRTIASIGQLLSRDRSAQT